MDAWARKVARVLRGPTGAASAGVFERHRRAVAGAALLLRGFYAFFPFWLATHLDLLRPLWSPPPADFTWPVAWLAWVGPDLGAPLVLVGAGLAFILAPFAPERRPLRVAVAVALLEVLGLQYSFGKIHHLMHGWLYASFLFAAFLPSAIFVSPARAPAGLRVFHAAQVTLGLTYSLAGLGKIIGAVYQAVLGQTTSLHPSALAVHIADRLLQTHPEPTLGPFLMGLGPWLWPAMLGTLYLQLFALPAAFRPALHRLWGAGLIAFHVVTAVSLTIDFTPNILLLGSLFVASPFAPPSTGWRAQAEALPLFGPLFRRRRGS